MVSKLLSAARQETTSAACAVHLGGRSVAGGALRALEARFGVPLLDGLGTAEMWHVFVSNRPGAVRPGTLGQVVPGFELRVADDEGRELPDGEIGWLWVKGGSRPSPTGSCRRRASRLSAARGTSPATWSGATPTAT